LFEWLLLEAKKRGYGTAKFSKVLFVADGAEVLSGNSARCRRESETRCKGCKFQPIWIINSGYIYEKHLTRRSES
ncbi:MAG TPA: hypothetical protein VI296_07885, partial [Candidatus Dormibacteraeota bacterium]